MLIWTPVFVCEMCTEAAEEISNVASHINENIRQRENFQKMLSIQNSLTGEGAPKILAPGERNDCDNDNERVTIS